MNAPPTTEDHRRSGTAERTVGRERLLRQVEREVGAARPVTLRGGPGVGKTRVLDELGRRHLGPVHAVDGRSAASLAEIADEVTGRAEMDQEVLLLVDDAQLLPQLEVARLHAWQERSWCRIVTAVPADAGSTSPTGAWWQGERWCCLDVAPLSRLATAELLAQLLGGPPAPELVHELWRLSGGNPVAIGELLADARDSGCLAPAADSWQLVAPLPVRRLTGLLAARLEGLSEVATRALEVLALASPLPIRAASSLVHPHGIRELEARRLVRFRSTEAGRTIAIVDAVHAEVVRSRLLVQERSQLLTEVAGVFDRLELTGRRRLDLARWRLELGGWSAEQLHAAAALARGYGEVVLAHDLASAALALGAGAATSRLASLGATERGAGAWAEAVPRGARPVGPGAGAAGAHALGADALLARRRMHGSVATGEIDADALLVTAHERAIGEGRWAAASAALLAAAAGAPTDRRGEVVAYAALLAALGGDIHAAERSLGSLASGERTALTSPGSVLAAVADAVIGAARGEHERVLDALERTAGGWTEGGPLLLPIAQPLLVGLDLLADSERPLRERVDAADDQVDASLRRFGVETGWWYAVDGWLRWQAGDLAGARQHLVAAAHACRRADPLRLRARVVADLAVLAALTGSGVEAEWRLGQVGADRDAHPAVGERCRLAELLVGAARRGVTARGSGLQELARAAATTGRTLDAVGTLHLAARLGGNPDDAARAAELLSELLASAPTRVVAPIAEHLAAWADGDAERLDAVARSFAREGRMLLAAEAASQAGRLGAGERASALASSLLAVCPDATMTTLVGCDPVELSPRRRDAAVLAMSGADDRTIAARLGVSVRTVENHLARVYRHVGVAGRRELTALFDPQRAPFSVGRRHGGDDPPG